jgi:hypothetical protein
MPVIKGHVIPAHIHKQSTRYIAITKQDKREAETKMGVTEVLQGCYKGVTELLQRCYKSVTRALQRCYRGVTRVLQRCYKSVTEVSQGYYRGVTRVSQRCYKGVTEVLQGRYRGVTRVLQRCYKGVTEVLQECCRGVTRVLPLKFWIGMMPGIKGHVIPALRHSCIYNVTRMLNGCYKQRKPQAQAWQSIREHVTHSKNLSTS